MTCSRGDCEHIMCRTYIDGVGYICEDCQKEFKEAIALKPEIQTEGQIKNELIKFILTKTGTYGGAAISVDDFFRKYSRE